MQGEKPIRVLHVINSLEVGGAERVVAQLAKATTALNVDSQILVLGTVNDIIADELRDEPISIVRTEEHAPYAVSNILRLRSHLQSISADIVHVHLFPAQLWAALSNVFLQRRSVFVTTEHNTWNRRRIPLLRPLDWAMYHAFDHVVCISDATQKSLLEWLPFLEPRTSVIENGVDLGRVRSGSSAGGIRSSSEFVRLLTVGRLTAVKGHDVLIRALPLLPEVELQIIGDGELRENLENLAKSLQVDSRVMFMGRRGDVPELLHLADIYVQPSRVDGFCIAAVEAMAAGLPVVASSIPGLSDVVADGAELVPPDDPEALAAAIRRIAKDPERRALVSARARARSKQFSIERMAERHVALYRNLLQRFSAR